MTEYHKRIRDWAKREGWRIAIYTFQEEHLQIAVFHSARLGYALHCVFN